ncbi:MAG: hypothetical protein WCC64_09160 [Aliidongia sp.]
MTMVADFGGLDALQTLARKLGCYTCYTENLSNGNTQPIENGCVTRVTPVTPKNNDTNLQTVDTSSGEEREIRIAERAAILEFDGGFSRDEAERVARAELCGDDGERERQLD